MNKLRQVLRLHTQGKGKNFIKENTGLSRNTVKKYVRLFLECKLSYQELDQMSDKDLDDLFENNSKLELPEKLIQLTEAFPSIDKALKRKGVTMEIVWKDYY